MRSQGRLAATVALSIAVIAAGYAASPKELPTLEFVTPVSEADDATPTDDQ